MSNFLKGINPIPVQSNEPLHGNAKIAIQFEAVKPLNPIFSYRHLSLNCSDFCYNNPKIDIGDFFELFKIKKEVSSLNFTEIEGDKKYHFHHVKPKKINNLLNSFRLKASKELGKPIKEIELPEIYQFAVYTTEEKAPRILGFLGKDGLFNVIWFDLEHKVYGKPKPKRLKKVKTTS